MILWHIMMHLVVYKRSEKWEFIKNDLFILAWKHDMKKKNKTQKHFWQFLDEQNSFLFAPLCINN